MCAVDMDQKNEKRDKLNEEQEKEGVNEENVSYFIMSNH